MSEITFDPRVASVQSGQQQTAAAYEDILDAFESGDIGEVAAAVVELSQAQLQVAATAEVIKSDNRLSRHALDLIA